MISRALALPRRAEAVQAVLEQLQEDMRLLCITAVEDKLQVVRHVKLKPCLTCGVAQLLNGMQQLNVRS